jgi:hypothetical protein
MNKNIFVLAMLLALAGCQPSAPPEIDISSATVDELSAYIQTNCQGDFRMHVRCMNAIDSKRKKALAEGRNHKGSIANVRSEAELFGR